MTREEAQKEGQELSATEKCAVCILQISDKEFSVKKETEVKEPELVNVISTFSLNTGKK